MKQGRLVFSRRAEQDLTDIRDFTLLTWGEGQAEAYLGELERSCRLLIESPELGRACDEIRVGLRRLEAGSHVIFYRAFEKYVRVIRILHKRMLPQRHAL